MNKNIIGQEETNPHGLKVGDIVSGRCGYIGSDGYVKYRGPAWFGKTVTKIYRDKYGYDGWSYQVDNETRGPGSELDAYEIHQSRVQSKSNLFAK